MYLLRNLLLGSLISLSTLSFAQKATYIANSGVFVEVGESKILIDAFFTNGRGKFATPISTQLDAMIAGKSPYNNLSLALMTHAHPDHLSGALVAKLLTTQKKLKCLTTPQGLDSIAVTMDDFESIHDRTLTFPISRTWKYYNQTGLTVKTAYAKHPGRSNARVQDLIFVITIDGKKILHLGDADMNSDRFDELKLQYESVDIAFVPFWYMTSFYGAEVVRKYVNAKKIIAVHFPENGSEQSIAKIKQFLPDATVFQNPGQVVSF